jgi:hypothetical protein
MRCNELDITITNERKRRIAHLRSLTVAELQKLPEAHSEVVEILGKSISITIFRESHERRLLILVRSDRPRFFGIISYGSTDGFWVSSDGNLAEVSDEDILNFFG